MKRILSASVLFVLLFMSVIAQAQIVRGRVMSASSAGPLSGAHVSVPELGISTQTDEKGYYELSGIPAGKYTFLFTYVGYAPDSVRVNIELRESPQKINRTLFLQQVDISEVVITATRIEQSSASVPAKTEVITAADAQSIPFISLDELLNILPGINASRNYGIFNKSGDVTMRGLNRNMHTLLLVDGLPLSLLDGSATNWNRFDIDNIERIEVVKGPNSSLYGGNAMGGVINIITRKPQSNFEGSGKAFYGSFATLGGNIRLSGRTGKTDRKFIYGSLDGYLRQSDGYVMAPDSIRTINDMELYINEYNFGGKMGYVFAPRHYVEAEYRYSYDMRGAGSIIFEQGGNFNRYKTQYVRGHYGRTTDKTRLSIDLFWKEEHYRKQSESIKSSGLYYFYHTNAVTSEKGLFVSWSVNLPGHQELTVGTDLRNGSTDNKDTYHTSSDTVAYAGTMGFYGLYLQDQLAFLKGRLHLIAGARLDLVTLSDAYFSILSPSLATSFMSNYQGEFPDTNWLAFSPRLGLQWNIKEGKRVYISWSRGFRPGTLSDMCRTGDVNKGFKLANPLLLPESIDNFELGSVLNFSDRHTIEPTVFYSLGHRFQYFVGTGDSTYTAGSRLKPIIRRENIGEVHIYGAEFRYTWLINKHFDLIFNYSYSHSNIAHYELGTYEGKDLTGLSLIEVPEHILFARIHWKNRFVNAVLGAKYCSDEWVDDENTIKTAPVFTLDAKLYRTFLKRVTTTLTVQNLLNAAYLDSKGNLNPGRYIQAEVRFIY